MRSPWWSLGSGAQGGWNEALFYGSSLLLFHFAYHAHGSNKLLEGGITYFCNGAPDSLQRGPSTIVCGTKLFVIMGAPADGMCSRSPAPWLPGDWVHWGWGHMQNVSL